MKRIFDRERTTSPYTLEEYIRDDHEASTLYIGSEVAWRYSGKSQLSSNERIAWAKRRVSQHQFVSAPFGHQPYLNNSTVSPQSYEHNELASSIAKIHSNANLLAEATRLMRWFNNSGVYLAGGSILSAHFGQPPKDYDFYFRDKKTRLEFQQFLFSEGYQPICVTYNAMTLGKEGCTPIQLIFNHYYDLPEFCILTFDWSPAMFVLFVQNSEDGNYTWQAVNDQPLSGMSYACEWTWGWTLENKQMNFNMETLGGKYSSFYRALKYRQKYGLTVAGIHGFDDDTISPAFLLSPGAETRDMYGIPKPWDNLWTSPGWDMRQDVLGSIEDLGGSAYDNTLFLYKKAQPMLEAHRATWSKPAARRICAFIHDTVRDMNVGNLLLPFDKSLVEEINPHLHTMRRIVRSMAMQTYGSGVYAQWVNTAVSGTEDQAFALLMKGLMSMEVACEAEFERIVRGESECPDSLLNQQSI